MMKDDFDSLDEVFDITSETTEVEAKPIVKKEKKPLELTSRSEDRAKDYQYSRAQLTDLVEKMQETLAEAMESAYNNPHPRSFEVAFNGAKATADVVDKLADLQKKMKDLDEEEPKVNQNNTQNNIFLSGSTEELLKTLKEAGSISNNNQATDK